MIPEAFVRVSSSILAHLAEPAARSLILGCFAAIVLAAFRVKRVSLRIFAWTTVLYGALAIALVGWVLPSVPLRVPAIPTLQAYAQKTQVLSSLRTVSTFVSLAKNSHPSSHSHARTKATETPASAATAKNASKVITAIVPSETPVRTSKLVPPVQTPKPRTIPWTAVAAAVYLIVAFLLSTRLLLGLFLSHRLSRLSAAISDADTLRRLRFRAYASGLETVPRLAESELVSVPATLGVFRPVILLPVDWREWDEAQFDAILAHEVSHVARRDALTQRISLVHRAIFWFSPLSWWLDRKLNELAEEASDEAALGAGADQNRYAEILMSFFADLAAASGRVWWQGVSMASDGSRAGHAEKRLKRILAWQGTVKTGMRRSLAVTLVALAAPLIFVTASLHPVIAYGQEKPQGDSHNVILPGGPKAPALPNAPTGGVTAPALAPAPQGGVSTPPMAPAPNPTLAPTGPIQIKPSPPSATPALMPVPGAPEHPPIVPGPIAKGPVTPSALTAPAVAPAPQGGVNTPPMSSVPPVSSFAPQASTSSDVRQAEAAVKAAKKQVEEAKRAIPRDEDTIREAQEALKDAEQAMADAHEAMKAALEQDQSNTIINGNFNSGWGPRYVMMSANSNEVSMSGSEEDLQHARNLRKKINGDFIWFEHDEKSYIITDQDFIAKAKALFAPEEALGKQQDELGRQQDELGRQQDALGEKMDGVKVKIRDITPELEQIRARMKELEATGATQEELGRLQSRLGELQSEVGHSQSEAGVGQSEIGRQQAELGRKQGELGRRQGELGRQQGELAKKASQQLRGMFEDAISKGIAKPE
ncbi:MAG TPA: M56 family metallopeptidase [Candidatus Acidoferrales bacterium]|nr:M56 family metallopeptidase [Candidatus Acidoferrales bacterium]